MKAQATALVEKHGLGGAYRIAREAGNQDLVRYLQWYLAGHFYEAVSQEVIDRDSTWDKLGRQSPCALPPGTLNHMARKWDNRADHTRALFGRATRRFLKILFA